ncbi:unnamed protein product, partial [marine sediment metagenome]
NTPLHDWSSHGSDAWRYLALVVKEHSPEVIPGLPLHQEESNFKPQDFQPLKAVDMKLHELFEARDDAKKQRSRHQRLS